MNSKTIDKRINDITKSFKTKWEEHLLLKWWMKPPYILIYGIALIFGFFVILFLNIAKYSLYMATNSNNFIANLFCIPFIKKNGTLNKNLDKKCGGWWLVWGSIFSFYLLIALAIGPGAFVGLIILIPTLHYFTIQINNTTTAFAHNMDQYYNGNNSTKKTIIKATPFKKYINSFIFLLVLNIIITLICAIVI
jgi:hypothetical protein